MEFSCISSELFVSGKCYPKNMVRVQHVIEDSRNGESGIFERLWTSLLKIYNNKIGINWSWQSLDDSISGKSPLEGMTGHNPTIDRSKLARNQKIF